MKSNGTLKREIRPPYNKISVHLCYATCDDFRKPAESYGTSVEGT